VMEAATELPNLASAGPLHPPAPGRGSRSPRAGQARALQGPGQA